MNRRGFLAMLLGGAVASRFLREPTARREPGVSREWLAYPDAMWMPSEDGAFYSLTTAFHAPGANGIIRNLNFKTAKHEGGPGAASLDRNVGGGRG